MTALQRAGSQADAPVDLKAALVQRLWEFKETNSALTVLKNLDPDDPKTDSQLTGLHALCWGAGHDMTGMFNRSISATTT